MESLLRKASDSRSKSSTNSNVVSSRSHGVFILHLEGENSLGNMRSRGSLSLIDLAGSENIDKSGSIGDQMTEAQNINKSMRLREPRLLIFPSEFSPSKCRINTP